MTMPSQFWEGIFLNIPRFIGHADDFGRELSNDFHKVILCGDDIFDLFVGLRRFVEAAAEEGDSTLLEIDIPRRFADRIDGDSAAHLPTRSMRG